LPSKLPLLARLILACVTSWPLLSFDILSFIFAAYFSVCALEQEHSFASFGLMDGFCGL